ncbi:MAG: tRNA uridine-5-carboxymethylaminomethyl(34) synthesis GTPase MnmE, partial [Candidatus Omnitrophica bacterium]|nr:tRNA uridine-5-carboxymethylaminomethyl(34) synthesis GTPase MnmE [Candidatus Omnitrophota bacterium]
MTEDTIAAISTPLGEGGIGIVRVSGPEALALAESVARNAKGEALKMPASHRLRVGRVVNASGETLDEVLFVSMRAPKSYTAEDVVEIHCHGGIRSTRAVLELLVRNGARLAEPGEFTKRAFLNGRLDLTQAEAVLDLIRAQTDLGLRVASEQLSGRLSGMICQARSALMDVLAEIEAALDFPDEGLDFLPQPQLRARLNGAKARLEGLAATARRGRVIRHGLT